LEWEAFNADVLFCRKREGIHEILKNATPERIEASFQQIDTETG
jgi:hypothetical protein